MSGGGADARWPIGDTSENRSILGRWGHKPDTALAASAGFAAEMNAGRAAYTVSNTEMLVRGADDDFFHVQIDAARTAGPQFWHGPVMSAAAALLILAEIDGSGAADQHSWDKLSTVRAARDPVRETLNNSSQPRRHTNEHQ